MKKNASIPAGLLLVVLSLALLTGCQATPHFEDPMSVMTHSKDPDLRMAAARQADKENHDDPARITALHSILWDWGRGDEERQYAIDQLVAYDEPAFRSILSRRIMMIQNPLTLRYIFNLAVQRKWTDLTPAIVRSYARPMATNIPGDRPEIAALLALNPGRSIEQIVFDVFANASDQVSINQQTAAWDLLWQITDRQKIQGLLAQAPSTTPLVIDLKASLQDLHALPFGKEGILRLAFLRDPARKNWWLAATAMVAKLNDEQKNGLELRHLPILLESGDSILDLNRQQLVDRVGAMLDKQDHFLRGPNYDGPMRDYPQRFEQAVNQLTWADLATIMLLSDTLQKPAVRQALFAQADADVPDNQSEHGGVITRKDHDIIAQAFAPLVRQQNYKFVPSQEMIDVLYTGLAHYHFHAQQEHNRDFAGPGIGDMRLAQRLESNCLVFTFIDHDTLNIDYYQPNGAVVDLGAIRR